MNCVNINKKTLHFFCKKMTTRLTRSKRVTKRKFNNKKKMIEKAIELKFIDKEASQLNLGNTWFLFNNEENTINGIAQGTDDDERIGRVISMHSMHFRYFVSKDKQEGDTTPIPDFKFRVIVFLDKQCNQAVPLVGEVLDLTNAEPVLAYRNLRFVKRFQILHDKIHMITSNQTCCAVDVYSEGERISATFRFSKVWKTALKVTYVDIVDDITAITNTSIQVMAVANQNVGDRWGLTWNARLRYTG